MKNAKIEKQKALFSYQAILTNLDFRLPHLHEFQIKGTVKIIAKSLCLHIDVRVRG